MEENLTNSLHSQHKIIIRSYAAKFERNFKTSSVANASQCNSCHKTLNVNAIRIYIAARVCDQVKSDLCTYVAVVIYVAIHKEHDKCKCTLYNYVQNEAWLYMEIELVKCYICM